MLPNDVSISDTVEDGEPLPQDLIKEQRLISREVERAQRQTDRPSRRLPIERPPRELARDVSQIWIKVPREARAALVRSSSRFNDALLKLTRHLSMRSVHGRAERMNISLEIPRQEQAPELVSTPSETKSLRTKPIRQPATLDD